MLGLLSSRRRGAAFVVAAALLVTAASGCNAGHPPAATVDGTDVPISMVEDLVHALTVVGADTPAQFTGEGEGTLQTEALSPVLAYLIDDRLILDEVAQRGLTITAADRTKGKTQLLGRLAQAEADQTKVFAALDKATQTLLVDAESGQLLLQAELGKKIDQTAAAKKVFDADPKAYDQICLSTITVATKDLVALVQNRLKSGEAFAAVAKSASIDDSKDSGGSLGCIPESQITNAEITAQLTPAKVGDVVGPFGTEGQYILVRVDERKPASFADAKADIISGLGNAGEAQFASFLQKASKTAKISVNPRFGRWSKAQGTVVPPVAPQAPKGSGSTATTVAATAAP